MRNRALAILILVMSVTVAAQQTTPQTPPASGAEVQTPAGKAQSTTPQGQGMAHPHQHGQPAGQGEMAAHMEKMRATLAQMKANIAKVKDANVRQALQADADLWSHMVEHMQQMQSRMQGGGHPMMHGGGKGMGHGDGGCCAGMMKKEGASQASGSATATEDMAAGMGTGSGMSCGKGGAGCCGGGEGGGGCCGGGQGGGCCGGKKG